MIYDLLEHNAGMGGPYDETTKLIARFTSIFKAVRWLEARGYTYEQCGKFYHADESNRNTIGQLSYTVTPTTEVPVDPVFTPTKL